MKKNHILSQGLVSLAFFAILMFIYAYIPFLSIIVPLFLPLPFLLFSVKYSWKWSIGLLIVTMLVALIITGLSDASVIFITLILGIIGTVMGISVRNGKSKFQGMLATSITMLVMLVIMYGMITSIFHINILREMKEQLYQSTLDSFSLLSVASELNDGAMLDQVDAYINQMALILPSAFLIFSCIVGWLLVVINYPLAKKMGVAVPKFMPVRFLQLPRSLLWYYLIAVCLSLVVESGDGFLYMAVLNITLVLQLLMILQGYSFVFFFAYEKKWSIVFPIIIIILTLVVSPLLYFIRLIGIVDLGFGLRQYFQRKK